MTPNQSRRLALLAIGAYAYFNAVHILFAMLPVLIYRPRIVRYIVQSYELGRFFHVAEELSSLALEKKDSNYPTLRTTPTITVSYRHEPALKQ